MQLMSPPCALSQLVQSVAALIHSATHSQTFPAMSWAPHAETQALRAPVSAAKSELVTHVAPWSSFAPGSGVPLAAACHSWLVSRRFPASRQACSAWNHVTHVLGGTPATETANTGAVQLPLGGKVGPYSIPVHPSIGIAPIWTAPPAAR